jgi:hypothetical protein
MSSEHLALI